MVEGPENAKDEKGVGVGGGAKVRCWTERDKQEFKCRRPGEASPCVFLGRHIQNPAVLDSFFVRNTLNVKHCIMLTCKNVLRLKER